jgi:hypothetical protein
VPLGFEEIDVGAKLDAAVDLFAFQPEGVLGGQAEGVEQPLIAALGIDDGILAAGTGEIIRAMLPERCWGADRGSVVAALQDAAQAPFEPPFAAYFGSSMLTLSSEAKKSAKLVSEKSSAKAGSKNN